jgi:hypothetical protein
MLTSCTVMDWTGFSYKLHCNWINFSHCHCHHHSTLLVWNWTVTNIIRVTLRSLCTAHTQKTKFYCCVRNTIQRTSHVIPSQYCWSVTSPHLHGSVFTELWPRNRLCNPAVPLLVHVLLTKRSILWLNCSHMGQICHNNVSILFK